MYNAKRPHSARKVEAFLRRRQAAQTECAVVGWRAMAAHMLTTASAGVRRTNCCSR